MEYPKYVSHKEVSAARIERVEQGADGSTHYHLEDGSEYILRGHVGLRYLQHPRHVRYDSVGDYLVRDERGNFYHEFREDFESDFELKPAPAEGESEKRKDN